MSVPQANITLTAIGGGGASEDYDYAGGATAAQWSGREGAYLSERTERVARGDATSVVVTRTVVLSADLGIEVAQGDVLSYTRDNGTIESATVRAVARRKIPGVPGTVRIALEDA